MITNEKQYRSTRALIEQLRQSLAGLGQVKGKALDPLLLEIQRDALTNQIAELEEDINLHDALRSGKITRFEATGLEELPDILIQARIARGMSQKDLGTYLGLKEQQIQRYEAERYHSASLDRLIEISDALGVKIHKRAELVGDGRMESVDPAAWKAFPIAEMYNRGWFEDFSGTMAQARKAAADLVPAFLRGAYSRYAPDALHRKSVRTNGQVNEAAIAAWEARVRRLADRDPPEVEFDRDRICEVWLQGLIALSLDNEGPAKVADYLRDAGIALIIERQLPGTLLDGAALCSLNCHAIIALTLRHDRLDNFWFTLLHEIGHLKLHIGQGEFVAIFDDIEAPAATKQEKGADLFAQEVLLSSEKWKLGVSRYTRTEKAVLTDAKRFGVGPAIIAGRIRREAQDYTLLRSLVGAGEVRRQFGL
jgi:HTH-type transcriptional regulator/antitoxin HigA